MLQFASQLVEAALTTAKQLWGTKTINTDSLLHPEPTCSLLRVPHREATPTSTIAITVYNTHTLRAKTHNFLCHVAASKRSQHACHILIMPPRLCEALITTSLLPYICVGVHGRWPASLSHSGRLCTLRSGTITARRRTRPGFSLTLGLYTLTPLFHIAMLLMHPCSYSRSIWCMCQAWGGGLTDYIKLQCGKRAQRCQSGLCDGRSVEQ